MPSNMLEKDRAVMINAKIFAGALVVAGLMTACGGEVENPGGEQGGTGQTEGAIIEALSTRGAYEPISCNMDYYSRTYFVGATKVVEQCRIAHLFSNQYRAGSTVSYSPGQSIYINADGLASNGILSGDQSLYTGVPNGMVMFKGGYNIGFTGAYGAAKVLGGGILAANTCLKTLNASNQVVWRACKGGEDARFGVSTGYVSNCTAPTDGFGCP
jgi:hypothetical protein